MTITNYTTLKAAVSDTLNRDDLASVVPTFIALAEAGIERDLRHFQMEKTTALTAASRYTALPADYLQPISLYVSGANADLQPMSRGEMQDERRRTGDVAGDPFGYHITAGQLELWPTPNAEKTVEVLYYGTLPRLGDSQGTTWLLTRAPDLYLYGALAHTAPYLREDNRITVWAALYQSALDGMNADSDAAKFGGGSLRIR